MNRIFDISFTLHDFVRVLWAFIFTYVSTFFALSAGWGPINNLDDLKAAAIALAPACFAAAWAAIKNLVLADGSLIKG